MRALWRSLGVAMIRRALEQWEANSAKRVEHLALIADVADELSAEDRRRLLGMIDEAGALLRTYGTESYRVAH